MSMLVGLFLLRITENAKRRCRSWK